MKQDKVWPRHEWVVTWYDELAGDFRDRYCVKRGFETEQDARSWPIPRSAECGSVEYAQRRRGKLWPIAFEREV